MKLCKGITIIPVLHGRIAFARHVRELCLNERFDCIAVDIPALFQDEIGATVDLLPYISAAVARSFGDRLFYVPADPCDATIEGIRQSKQQRGAFACIGYPDLEDPNPLQPLPDEYAITRIGFEPYAALCLQALGNPDSGSPEDIAAQYSAHRLLQLRTQYRNVLAIVHFRHYVRTVYHYGREQTCNLSYAQAPSFDVQNHYINPDHLYFALGELPFVSGKFEKERYDAFSEPVDFVAAVKNLFRETRDEYFDEQENIVDLSPARIQVALTFLRNLTVMSGALIPSLLDIIAAAKGVGGNAFALRILKSARYYPYLPFELKVPLMGVGIDRATLPGQQGSMRATNLFRDTALQWRKIPIHPDPSMELRKKYRFTWNPVGMCSHVPEDNRIESFNAHLRNKTLRVLSEDHLRTEKFRTSVKDGIDIRETLRNWFTGEIYVKELPPSRGKVDTVVIIFDEFHDEQYPHCATWYAEHPEESTLSFYATDPFDKLIGPGVARSYYGGLSLLFPPRAIPNIFELTQDGEIGSLSMRLTYGALLFSREKSVAFVSARKPGVRLRAMATKLKKHLVWIPLSSFSTETIRRLRRFHILNGKMVRSWASRFIGDE